MITDNVHKYWLKSKTILWNLVITLAGVWSMFEGYVPNLRAVLGDEWFGIVMFSVGVIGIWLRIVTKDAIVPAKKAVENDLISRP